MATTTDRLAQEIQRVDGAHKLGAGALAEALMPWIEAEREKVKRPEPGLYARALGLARGEYSLYHLFSDGAVYSDDNTEHAWLYHSGPLPSDLVRLVPDTRV